MRRATGAIAMHRVDCAVGSCPTRYEASMNRSDFETWLRKCGWRFQTGAGWICPKHQKESVR